MIEIDISINIDMKRDKNVQMLISYQCFTYYINPMILRCELT